MSTPTITLVPPASNKADDWNTQIKEAAEKAGVPVPAAPGAAAPAAKKQDDEPTIHEAIVTLNGKDMVFRDADPVALVKQITAAVEAAQPAPAAAKVEEPKPAFTEAELFDISIGIQKGDVNVLEGYIEKSGLLDRLLEKKGLKVDDLKAQIEERQSGKLNDEWEAATKAFGEKVKAGEIDYPGGPQNMYLMGLMLAELGLRNKPSVESFEKCFAELKKRNMIFPVAKAGEETTEQKPEPPKPKKAATSSTAVGTAGGHEVRAVAPTGKVELDITQL